MQTGKEAAGAFAATLVKDGMMVGLGTGSTAHYFIEHLAQRCRGGLKIKAAATSQASSKLAQEKGIPLLNMDQMTALDLTVDGADEVDPKKRLIKGAGGALLREKILASSSSQMVVVVDETKMVDRLGAKGKLPLEILPFAHAATLAKINKLGLEGKIRKKENGSLYITDNGNLIYDLFFTTPPSDAIKLEEQLISIPGVLETGFFFHLAHQIVIGFNDGHIEIKK